MTTKVKKLAILVGPPGSGKSTMANNYAESGYEYINQDLQGKEHLALFDEAILGGKDVVVDRMNFSKGQRARYLELAKSHGYFTSIIVIHESYSTCLNRMIRREGHATIKDEKSARAALHTFFTKYERVEDAEADDVIRIWPGPLYKPSAIICDLDGTLCDIEHRRHHVRTGDKRDWKSFFEEMVKDTPKYQVMEILKKFSDDYKIVYCSGRPKDYEEETSTWLKMHMAPLGWLFMRERGDHRRDDIVKEIILDFEILTRFKPYLILDDRDQVVAMWRKRGYTCLQVDYGDF